METPSSTRRITRSQASALNNNIPMSSKSRKQDETEKVLSRSRKGKTERSALFDITNDSPIVGIAMGTAETPSSMAKNVGRPKRTPGSGEAILRGQVKTLLQKVEEEAELSKICLDQRPFPIFQGLLNSPAGLLAPTPANTPLVLNLSNGNGVLMPVSLPTKEEEKNEFVDQVIDVQIQEALDSRESVITRALLFDSPGKSETSDDVSAVSSMVIIDGSCSQEKPTDEDNSSVWSLQVNTSPIRDEEDDEEEETEDEGDYEEDNDGEEEEEGGDEDLINELCEGLINVCVQEKRDLPKFTGRHTRFIYDSEDEVIEGEEIAVETVSPSVLRLNGMPTPEGKHLRFPEEEED